MNKICGCYTALATPFDENGQLNLDSLEKLIEFQINQGINGLVPCGTTGETPTFTKDEYEAVIRQTVDIARPHNIPVMAGTGTNNTKNSIRHSLRAIELGVDTVMVVTPYYNKPDQIGLIHHYSEIAMAIYPHPLVIYNVPGRTNVNILPETVAQLHDNHDNIIGIKDASGDLQQVLKIRRLLDADFSIMCGEDGVLLPYLASGANGVVSVMSNVIPKLCADLYQSHKKGAHEKALQIQLKISPLIEALFCEVNPIPVKFALNKLGLSVGKPRSPLHELSENYQGLLLDELRNLTLIDNE